MKTFTITTSLPITYTLKVEREETPENLNDLLSSITRDELVNCYENDDVWSSIKYGFATQEDENYFISDEEGEECLA
jgi:hypothetical protein